jgi:hypothetical protein
VTKRIKAKTMVSFQVTFELPEKMSIQQARLIIEDTLVESELRIASAVDIKVHLVNKEIQYGQR